MTNSLPPSKAPNGRTILLVEDEPFVRDATCRILQNAGYAVLCAADAQEALTTCDHCANRIDLLMSDVVLPGRSGIQLVEDLRSRFSSISLLLTSGYGESITNCDALDSAIQYLAKPYSRQLLLDKIDRMFAARSCAAAGQAS